MVERLPLMEQAMCTTRYSGTTDFDFDAGTFNLTPNGGYDIYLLKMSTDGGFYLG